MKDFSNEITAYALKNAIEFGKCDSGKILPKLFQHGLDKKDIKFVIPKIQEIVKKVNSLKKEEKESEFEKLKKYVKEHEEKEGLPDLENAISGKVITRLAPEPSKYNHIGHALVFMIQYLYSKKYDGKCILRFDDTNPEKSTKEFYDSMIDDLTWLGIKWDKEYLASDNMEKYYKLAEKLIEKGNAFTCTCTQEKIRELREKMKPCECRNKKVSEIKKEWKLMLEGKYKEEKITLRLKGNMKSNNGVMRDPVIFRISFAKHFDKKSKYFVWPMYDFENPVEDAISGVTHIIRTNEFELRAELHEYLLKLLELKMPIVKEIGRYQIAGAETQGRIIREMIEKKEVIGWDDPRLVTIKALRRRGFVPQMFQELSLMVGLSKSSGHIDPTVLASVNRKIIDKQANRFSFIENPINLEIKNSPKIKEISVPVHPDKQEKKKIEIKDIFISKSDFENNKGKEIRLIHLFNIKLDKKQNKAEFTSLENKDISKINWVSDYVNTKIFMPDGTWKEGIAEKGIEKLKINEIIQFERFGFCKLDKISKNTYEFWFTHQ